MRKSSTSRSIRSTVNVTLSNYIASPRAATGWTWWRSSLGLGTSKVGLAHLDHVILHIVPRICSTPP